VHYTSNRNQYGEGGTDPAKEQGLVDRVFFSQLLAGRFANDGHSQVNVVRAEHDDALRLPLDHISLEAINHPAVMITPASFGGIHLRSIGL
jgi:hypothetical protein